MTMPRVLAVGFDGATFNIIKPLIAAGRLPNLQRMMEGGASGILRSTIPPITPSAWTSVFTGKNAGKHGIFGFGQLDYETGRFRLVRTDQHKEKTLWQLLGEAGKRSIVVDVPYTYPPRPLNGLMITGYGTPRTPGTTFTYPENLGKLLPAGLRPEVRVALPTHKFDRSRRFIDEWGEVMAGRRRLLNHLIAEEAWDFFMVVFSITDNMAHVFWTYVDPGHPNYRRPEAAAFREAFFSAYEQCDEILGELMARAGAETTTLVMSDHGFGSVRPRQYVFRRLLTGGYLATQTAGGSAALGNRAVKWAARTYSRFPYLREWVKGLRPERRNSLTRVLKDTGLMVSGRNVDPARSQVIPSEFGLQLWINDRDRFAAGIVPPEAKEELLAELKAYLLEDRDATNGRPIVAAVYRGSELYEGPNAAQGPDLVIEYTDFHQPGMTPESSNPYLEGGHTLDGIFLAHGPAIRSTEVAGARLIDLAPTILYLLDEPVPPDVDGSVIEGAIIPAHLEEQPVKIADSSARWEQVAASLDYTDEQEREVKEQLRRLGYL
jgi:predicted AlkP superfamily phosphohydrolase/phosphomutase